MPDPTKGQQVTITLPPGVTPEQFNKSYSSWEDQKVRNAAIMKADWRAMSDTCKKHSATYLQRRVIRWRELGLDPTNLKEHK